MSGENPAFPIIVDPRHASYRGISKKEMFSSLILQGLVSNSELTKGVPPQDFSKFVRHVHYFGRTFTKQVGCKMKEPRAFKQLERFSKRGNKVKLKRKILTWAIVIPLVACTIVGGVIIATMAEVADRVR